jgi:hypothetical protein
MAAILSLAQQLEALIARIKTEVGGLKSVVGLEELEEAMETDELLPAAVVIYSGDYPEKPVPGLSVHAGQKINRYWSVIVVLELTAGPGEALDLIEAVEKAGVGWRPCRGARFLAAAGKRFVAKFNQTRVVYEVRFTTMTTMTTT